MHHFGDFRPSSIAGKSSNEAKFSWHSCRTSSTSPTSPWHFVVLRNTRIFSDYSRVTIERPHQESCHGLFLTICHWLLLLIISIREFHTLYSLLLIPQSRLACFFFLSLIFYSFSSFSTSSP